jgi:hypothetical protein
MKNFWRRLHNEGLDLHASPNIRMSKSSIMRWARHVARMGERRVEHWVLLEECQGKRQLGRPRCRWGDNIKIDF